MRSTIAFLSLASVLTLVSATGMPHIIEDGAIHARQDSYPEPEPTSTSTTTEIEYVTVTHTIPTSGYGAPYTSIVVPEPEPTTSISKPVEPTPEPYPEAPQNSTITTATLSFTPSWTYSTIASTGTALPPTGGNQTATYTSVIQPPPVNTEAPEESDSAAAGRFGVSKVMGMMGLVAVVAGLL